MACAVILAAGRGVRLNGAGHDSPKCLLQVGGTTLLERQIEALRGAGIAEVAVVVGCQADRVRRLLGDRVQYVENLRYAQTNSLYSLWLARALLLDGFVVLNCDVLFHPQMLADLVTARCENAAVVAYAADPAAFGDEEMKVKVRRGRVVDFSKQMPPEEADAENVGMLKFGRDGAGLLVQHLDRLVAAGNTRDWAPRAFADFAREAALDAIGTRGYPWIEIDFPQDYDRARAEVLPAIEAGTPRPVTASFDAALGQRAHARPAPDEPWPVVLAADAPRVTPAGPNAE